MRIAILSDIHGNLVALEAVLRDMHAMLPDAIVCLGDVGADGPDPRGVIAMLRTLNASFVMGNADEQLLDPTLAPPVTPNDDTPKFQAMWEWGSAQLNDADRSFVRAFQPTISIPLDTDFTMLCYHGSPRSNVEAIRVTTPDEVLDPYFGGQSARIMVGGHTHQAFFRRHRHRWVINPGSVGLPFEWNPQRNQMINPARAEYAILTWQAGQWNVDLRAVSFDLAAFAHSVRQSGLPYADWFLADWQMD
ncbi:MAG: metallophosphoesterase family protein [Anaerolineae bacterium]|nr:metallophosphoesterase family protein [Anaerolineae bacterium]